MHQGHRVIEIGAVLLNDRKKSDENFHSYLNPERVIDEEASKVHGITNADLDDKPLFSEIAEEFLEFVHDVDLNFLKKDLNLQNELTNLIGKKYIFTNGSKAHASNVTKRIGIQNLFDGVFDIVDSDFIPKPSIEPYKKIIQKYGKLQLKDYVSSFIKSHNYEN